MMRDGIQQCGLRGGLLGILGLQAEMTQMHVSMRLAAIDATEREPPLVSLAVGLDVGTTMARYDGVCIRSDCSKKLTLCMIRSESINR